MKIFLSSGTICALNLFFSQACAWTKESVAGAPGISNVKVVPGRYILELSSTGNSARQLGSDPPASAVVAQIQDLGYTVEIKEDFSGTSSHFQGVSIRIGNDNSSTLSDIQAIPEVSNAWPVEPIVLDVEFDTSNPSRKWNPHISTRVDELHQKGFYGAGQRVCVVDTGVDLEYPALKGQIVGGKSMVTDDENLEDCVGHGTFVSSIIVGQNKDFVGVAPEAEIFMYKVFECSGSTTNDLVMKGMLTADADDCDIISVSIGSDTGYRNSLMSMVADRIGKDRTIVIAAGNAGETGVYFASSPASGLHAIAVGSTNSKQVMGWPAILQSSGGDNLDMIYVTVDGYKLNETVNAQVTVGTSDSCNYGASGTNDEALLLPRGICFGQGYNTLSRSGFGYVVMWDTYDQGFYYPTQDFLLSEAIHLWAVTNSSVGSWATEQISKGYTLNLTISEDADTAAFPSDRPNSGEMSFFSSWGPTFENDFSPSISAPGGAVYGCFPGNQFAVASGTSFSTPYIAGVAALFYAHAKKDHVEFAQKLLTTATSLSTSPNGKTVVGIASLAQQGAGMVDAVKLLGYSTTITSNNKISLNDTDNRISTHRITLLNNGTSEATYNISHESAVTIESRDQEWYPNSYYPPVIAGASGSIQAPDSITIGPGATADVDVTFIPPPSVANSTLAPLWSGKVLFGGDNGELVSVPYMGVEVSTYNWTPLEDAPLAFRYDDSDGILYPVDWQSRPYFPAQLDSPEIYYAIRYGSYEFSFDLVSEDWTVDQFSYPLQFGSGSKTWSGSLRTQPNVFGGYSDFPLQFIGRFNAVGFTRFQSFANGTDIPSGKYKLLSRVLRMFGDANNPDDWQLFLSDMFRIQLGDDPIPGETSSSAPISTPTSTQSSTFPARVSSACSCLAAKGTSTVRSSSTATSTSTSSSIIKTTTLKSGPAPTGYVPVFQDISIVSLDGYTDSFEDANEWLAIAIQINIPTRLYEGTKSTFILPPEFVSVASGASLSSSGTRIGTTAFDQSTGIFTITWGEWPSWHSNTVGELHISARLNATYQQSMTEVAKYVFEIKTSNSTFLPALAYGPINRTEIYSRAYPDSRVGDYLFDIEVPGSLGPWTSVSVSTTSLDDNGIGCARTQLQLGTALNSFGGISQLSNVSSSDYTMECSLRSVRMVYSQPVATADVLRFHVGAVQATLSNALLAIGFYVEIAYPNGTEKYQNLRMSYDKQARSDGSEFFSGNVDRDGPIFGGA
ncbi:alkaline elastase YaB [Cadophora sp. MPI-SDFR-AT-0126]|nr:alkaline elastase YaB [Leotiomycetes sp. MPI-SDFR-AT-0126]